MRKIGKNSAEYSRSTTRSPVWLAGVRLVTFVANSARAALAGPMVRASVAATRLLAGGQRDSPQAPVAMRAAAGGSRAHGKGSPGCVTISCLWGFGRSFPDRSKPLVREGNGNRLPDHGSHAFNIPAGEPYRTGFSRFLGGIRQARVAWGGDARRHPVGASLAHRNQAGNPDNHHLDGSGRLPGSAGYAQGLSMVFPDREGHRLLGLGAPYSSTIADRPEARLEGLEHLPGRVALSSPKRSLQPAPYLSFGLPSAFRKGCLVEPVNQ